MFKRRIWEENIKKHTIKLILIVTAALFVATPIVYKKIETHRNYLVVTVNGDVVGYASDRKSAEVILKETKNKVAKQEDLTLEDVNIDLAIAGKYIPEASSEQELEKNVYRALQYHIAETSQTAYEMDVEGAQVILESKEEVVNVIDQIKDPVDSNQQFEVKFEPEDAPVMDILLAQAEGLEIPEEERYSSMEIEQDVKVNETYVAKEKIMSEGEAYYQILQKFSFVLTRDIVYEEVYETEPQYIDNPVWTSDRQEVKQEAATGLKRYEALITYNGEEEANREVVAETIAQEAIPLIVERGVREPAEYVKPMIGGTFTSGYGARWGRTHKGLDWSCPVGTPVYAAKGGTVELAGEQNGYGNVIYINHPDGTQTRYAHLSEIQVAAGDSLLQGDQIALSGNTGRSTGPHLHFEILIGGAQVDPLEYVSKN